MSLTIKFFIDDVGNDGADDVVDGQVGTDNRVGRAFAALHLVKKRTRLNTGEGFRDELDIGEGHGMGDGEFLFVLARARIACCDVALTPEGSHEEVACGDGERKATSEVLKESNSPAEPVQRHHEQL